MPEKISGRTFYSPEESEPVTPEDEAEGRARIEERIRQLAEESERAQRGEAPPERYAADLPGRFGRDDFDGTPDAQWAQQQWAEEDQRLADQRRRESE